MTYPTLTVKETIEGLQDENIGNINVFFKNIDQSLFCIRSVSPYGDGVVSSYDINLQLVARLENGSLAERCLINIQSSKLAHGINDAANFLNKLSLFIGYELEIPVYASNSIENSDKSMTYKIYPVIGYEIHDNELYLIGGEEEVSLREELPYEEVEYAKTLVQYTEELKAFDPNMPLSIYVEKRAPEPYPWEPETDGEMEYYLYRQSLKFPETLEHCLFPVHKIIMRDGDCMFTHQNHNTRQGMTVGEALSLLEQFNPEEYMAVNIEIDQGNQTAIPYYFDVAAIEQKNNHCVLIGNANHQAAFDTHNVDIIETNHP